LDPALRTVAISSPGRDRSNQTTAPRGKLMLSPVPLTISSLIVEYG